MMMLPLLCRAEEKEVNFCAPPRNMTFTDCEDNDVLIKASQDCIKKIEAASKARGLLSSAAMGASVKNSEDKQKAQIDTASNIQNISLVNLDAMILDVENALDDVDAYFDEVVPPEDSTDEETGQLDIEILSENACYHETMFALDDAKQYLESNLAALEAAKAYSSGLKTANDTSSVKIENTQTGKVLNSKPTTSQPASKKTKHKASDISGTEEEKNKK